MSSSKKAKKLRIKNHPVSTLIDSYQIVSLIIGHVMRASKLNVNQIHCRIHTLKSEIWSIPMIEWESNRPISFSASMIKVSALMRTTGSYQLQKSKHRFLMKIKMMNLGKNWQQILSKSTVLAIKKKTQVRFVSQIAWPSLLLKKVKCFISFKIVKCQSSSNISWGGTEILLPLTSPRRKY